MPQGGWDAMHTEEEAYKLAQSGISNVASIFQSSVGAIRFVGAVIYSIFGRQPFLFGLFMVVLGTLTVSNIHKAALLLWQDPIVARRIGWFAVFFPQMILHSVLLLREMPVNYFLSLALISLIKFWKYKQQRKILSFIFFVMMAALFHTAVITALIGLLFAFLLIKQQNTSFLKQTLSRIFGIVVLIGGISFLQTTGYGMHKFGGSFDNVFIILEAREALSTQGGAAFPEWMRIQGGSSDLWKIPVRLVTFLFSPAIPFLVKTPFHVIGLIDAFLYIAIFLNIFRFRKQLSFNKTALINFVIIIVVALTFSIGTSNFGTAIRHRSKIAPLLLVLMVNHKKLARRRYQQKIYGNVNL